MIDTTTKYQQAADDEPVISVNSISKAFGRKKVLIDLTVKLYKGENLVILGKSGSGKSVLIKCIIGLLQPDKGSIEILGTDTGTLSREEMDKLRAKIGFLFQSNALYDSMNVRENMQFAMRRHMQGISDEQLNKLIIDTLENVDLANTVDMMPAELSGGMQKRIALARTLILHPKVILYDEPTTGLDPITGREISALINEVKKKYDASSIIISHDMNCVKKTADRILVLIDGTCYATGTYKELEASTDNNIKQFFE